MSAAPTFFSWFSGIGGFELAFLQAGWTCVGSCEIDEFARHVYATRFGFEPSLRDINDDAATRIPAADCWVAGFPCQDLSCAGRRAGWRGERSVLVFRLLELAARLRPRWLVLENVPGLLSVRRGRDFGHLLAALDELGYMGAWRVLDARHFGVAQRRRRVFLVCHLGAGADPAAVLFESESGGGHPAPRREARARVAAPLAGGARKAGTSPPEGGLVAGALGTRAPGERLEANATLVAETVTTKWAKGAGGPSGDETQNLVIPFDLAQITHPENRTRCDPGDVNGALSRTGTPMVAMLAAPLTSGGHPASSAPGRRKENLVALSHAGDFSVGHDATPPMRDGHRSGTPVVARTSHTSSNGQEAAMLVQPEASDSLVRRLTPLECERLQGFPDGWTLLPGMEKWSRRHRDGARYRVLGNAIAVPVVRWIAERLKIVHERSGPCATSTSA